MPEHILVECDPERALVFVRCAICKVRAIFYLPMPVEIFLRGISVFVAQHKHPEQEVKF